jgi:hypothetical protein
MKASLRVLPDAVALSLTSVKRTTVAPHVGQFYALDGAWDRKKVCVAVGNDGRPFVMLQNVGRIYSDGRWVKPTKASKPVKQYVGGNHPGAWYNRAGYVAVVPRGSHFAAKTLRVIPDPGLEGKRAMAAYQRKRKQERRAFLVAEIQATELVLEGLRNELSQL